MKWMPQVPRIWERETTAPNPPKQTTISPGKRPTFRPSLGCVVAIPLKCPTLPRYGDLGPYPAISRAEFTFANVRHKIARLCPIVDVNNCPTHCALSENQGSLNYHFAAITRQGGRADDVPDRRTVLRRTLFSPGIEGSSGIFGPRGNKLAAGYGENSASNARHTLSA